MCALRNGYCSASILLHQAAISAVWEAHRSPSTAWPEKRPVTCTKPPGRGAIETGSEGQARSRQVQCSHYRRHLGPRAYRVAVFTSLIASRSMTFDAKRCCSIRQQRQRPALMDLSSEATRGTPSFAHAMHIQYCSFTSSARGARLL